jgi:hypothetical protein
MMKTKKNGTVPVGCRIDVRDASGTYIARAAGLNITASCTAGEVPAAHACADKVFGPNNWSMKQTAADSFVCTRTALGLAEALAAGWVRDRLPDADTTVLIRCSGEEYPVWPGFHDGEKWCSADASTLEGPVLGWMELEDAASILDTPKTRGEVAR